MDKTDYIGIDIAKAKFDMALAQANGKYIYRTFTNNTKGFNDLLTMLKARGVVKAHIAMEATNIYWYELATFCQRQTHWTVSVLNPLQISAYAKCRLQRGKTDKLDAKLIARYCQRERPDAWQALSPGAQKLLNLLRQYDHLKTQIHVERTRLKTADPIIQPSIHDTISALEQQTQTMQALINQHIDDDDELSAGRKLLDSIPGVGEQTSPWLLAYLDNGTRFARGKQAACFAGLTPRPWQSGTSIKGRTCISKVGPSELRKILYMPAVVVSFGKHKNYQAFVKRLEANGKQKLEIIVAVMRKIITVAQAVLRTQTPFKSQLHAS